MSPAELDELGYHLRELRADLGLIRAHLETAAAPDQDRSVVRAWLQAEAMLAHDLEVHVPEALALLSASAPLAIRSPGRRAGDAASLATIAHEARQLVNLAVAAVPDIAELPSAAGKFVEVVRLVQAAHQLVSDAQPAVINDDDSAEPER